MSKVGRLPIIAVLILSLLGAAVTRHLAASHRHRGPEGPVAPSASPLSRMNSFALALLLGGLRGPLVMVLWSSSESQKSEKNLEDFDTKVEWIRLLQPEFDSVHIFQVWNKAYNISVQMASLQNKYATILDALDYAFKVDRERPHNINILAAIGGLYFDKLGNSQEKQFYREKVREQSRARADLVRVTFPATRRVDVSRLLSGLGLNPNNLIFSTSADGQTASITLEEKLADNLKRQFSGEQVTYETRPRPKVARSDPGWRRLEMDPLLDTEGRVLPQYLEPAGVLLVDEKHPEIRYNGADLQFLEHYQPFPYGVSTFALGYNYFKRSQLLQRIGKQSHAQLSDLVVDSRPGLALKNWAEEEWERGRRLELQLLGHKVPAERLDMELPSASAPTDVTFTAGQQDVVKEAAYSYDQTVRLAADAVNEYMGHLDLFKNNEATYQSHIDGLRAMAALVAGDRDYLLALGSGDPAQRQKYLQQAAEHYGESIRLNQQILLKYYVPDVVLEQVLRGKSKQDLPNIVPNVLDEATNIIARLVRQEDPMMAPSSEDAIEYLNYVARAQRRIQSIAGKT